MHAHPDDAVTAAGYRAALGLFATGVTVVAAYGDDGVPRGMTANAFTAVSLDPPLVLVVVRREARLHPVLERAGAYGVSVLGEGLEREARLFAGLEVATDGEPEPAFDERGGVPVLAEAMAWVAARIHDAHAAGDHTLFLGRVVALGVERPDEPPLGYHRSAFGRFVPRAGEAPLPLDAWGTHLEWWG